MYPSAACTELVKKWEGFSPKPYLCPAGVWTIGYGHTGGVHPGVGPWSEPEACAVLEQDLYRVGSVIGSFLEATLLQHQFDALVSFAFNVGAQALRTSTLMHFVNRGDDLRAAGEFDKWVYARDSKHKQVVLPGLVARRAEERKLFEGRS